MFNGLYVLEVSHGHGIHINLTCIFYKTKCNHIQLILI